MTSLLKSSFLRLFTGGFVLGMIGVLALQPAEAASAVHDVAPSAIARH